MSEHTVSKVVSVPRLVLAFESGSGRMNQCGVVVSGLDQGMLHVIGQLADRELAEVLRVVVDGNGSGETLAVSGSYDVVGDSLRFVPFLPFDHGVVLVATFDPRRLEIAGLRPLLAEFAVAPPATALPPHVEAVYPSGPTVPENLLRFTVRFSCAMRRGDAGHSIRIVDGAGLEVADVLYRPPIELWDRDMRCLTVLLDPGRLKRGVGPHRELGSPLRKGGNYDLVIGQDMRDNTGTRLAAPVCRRFRVDGALREAIDVSCWDWMLPQAGSRDALTVAFARVLDHALLEGGVRVATLAGLPVDGLCRVGREETSWSFVPALPWAPGRYLLHLATGLEDVCGNTVAAAFDRALRPGRELALEPTARTMPFTLS